MSGRCKTCNQPIMWATTAAGKAIPLDVEPVPDGNLVLDGGTARVADMFSPPGPRWRSHFATCVDADIHRRNRRR